MAQLAPFSNFIQSSTPWPQSRYQRLCLLDYLGSAGGLWAERRMPPKKNSKRATATRIVVESLERG